MTVKGVEVQLSDIDGNPISTVTDIEVCWFDCDTVTDFENIYNRTGTVSTDSNGWIKLNIENVSGLAVGDWGFLLCYKADGGNYKNSPIFASRMQVSSIASGTDIYKATDPTYVRNPDWPAQVVINTGTQKFAGLYAVYDNGSNFCALSAAGDYTVDWGDGSSTENISSGVQANHQFTYDTCGGTLVGAFDSRAVTFTDSGDTINITAHGFQNNSVISFASIVNTTGISTNTKYWVVNKTANTFQVATTEGGSPLSLTTDGSGTVFVPLYKVVIVTVVPNGGNLTTINIQKKHNQSGLSKYCAPWLDININGAYLTNITISAAATTIHTYLLEIVNIGENIVTNFSYMFLSCHSLQQVTVDSSQGTDFSSIFNDCQSLRYCPILNTSSCNNFSYMFASCKNLINIPILDTSAGTSFSYMFSSSLAIRTVPLLDTSMGNDFTYMFNNCAYLSVVPLLNTSAGNNFTSMFNGCSSLTSIPLLDTSGGIIFYGMFAGCGSLESIPLFNTSQGTDFSYIFNSCYSLRYISNIDTGLGTSMLGAFTSCYSLEYIPLLDTHLTTNFGSMLSGCYSLKTVPLLDTSAGTNFNSMFNSCYSLTYIPALNVSSGTSFTGMLSNCGSLSRVEMSEIKFNIQLINCMLSSAELNNIYTRLPTVTSKTITVSGNWGTTSDNPAIATAKGWTVTG